MVDSKACTHCGIVKPASEFGKAPDRPSGLVSWCNDCRRPLAKKYHRTEPHKAPKPCAICGQPCPTAKHVYCSEECEKESARRKARVYDSAKKVLRERKCKECGKLFIPEYGNKRRAFDTEECMAKYGSRVGKATRKARLRGAGQVECVDPFFILKRDGYRCYLCGVKTPKSLRGTTQPNAPEVDHVVPVGRGGSHTEANLRCICRKCNIKKSNRLLSEMAEADGVQLRLL